MQPDITLSQMHRIVTSGVDWSQVRPYLERGLDIDTAIECASACRAAVSGVVHLDAIITLVKAGASPGTAAALTRDEAIALAGALERGRGHWTAQQVSQLVDLTAVTQSPMSVDTLLAQAPMQVLHAANTLGGDGLSILSDALSAQVPMRDLTWLAGTLGERARPIASENWTMVSRLEDAGQRRLALVLAMLSSGSISSHVTNAIVRLIDTGHEEIARYLCDGMQLDEAIDTARAQAALDRANRVIKATRTGRMPIEDSQAQSRP